MAIAGYTNAGKSTLMNRLTGAKTVVADQLFATLDPTTRRIELPGRRRAVISDTVGFVGKLPHDLVEAFRSTLEEVVLADLIVHVADATSPVLDEQVDAVRRVLGEIGAGQIPEVLALNKIDEVPGSARARLAGRFPGSVAVSALTGEGSDGSARGDRGARAPSTRRGDAARPVRTRGRDGAPVPGGRGPVEGDGHRRDDRAGPRGPAAAVRDPSVRRGRS